MFPQLCSVCLLMMHQQPAQRFLVFLQNKSTLFQNTSNNSAPKKVMRKISSHLKKWWLVIETSALPSCTVCSSSGLIGVVNVHSHGTYSVFYDMNVKLLLNFGKIRSFPSLLTYWQPDFLLLLGDHHIDQFSQNHKLNNSYSEHLIIDHFALLLNNFSRSLLPWIYF